VKRNAQIELLRKVWLFERCSKKELEAIARVATPLDMPAGKVLTEQGKELTSRAAKMAGQSPQH